MPRTRKSVYAERKTVATAQASTLGPLIERMQMLTDMAKGLGYAIDDQATGSSWDVEAFNGFREGFDSNTDEVQLREKTKRNLPTRSVIVQAWKESGLPIMPSWEDAERLCWRCGDGPGECGYDNLDRCHLVSHALGGSSEPTNLVLLCNWCHRCGPNFVDPRFMLEHVTELVRRRYRDRHANKWQTPDWQKEKVSWALMILDGDVKKGRISWKEIGNKTAQYLKTKTIHHPSMQADYIADRAANMLAIFQTIIDELPDD